MTLAKKRDLAVGPARGWRPQRANRGGYLIACAAIILVIVLFALLLSPKAEDPTPASFDVVTPEPLVRDALRALPGNVLLGLPAGEKSYQAVFPLRRLWAGRMMLVDEAHPLPDQAATPNTLSVLKSTSGRVTCRDQQAVLAEDALDALDDLFRGARLARHNQLVLFAATRSEEQQRQLLTDRMAELSRALPLEEALAQAKAEIETPGCSEHQLPWCVDIRLCQGWNALPSEFSFEESEAGRWLVENCWRYGFIRRYDMGRETDASHRAWHFRYVGKAHAALMHTLGLSLEEYLAFLHEKGVVTVLGEGGTPQATAVCVPLGEQESVFVLPLSASVEDASVDNMGYAVVACLYPQAN